MDTREKLISRPGLHAVLEEHRRAGRRIVFASGVFDLLLAGHVRFLAAARHEGDVLVVAVYSDAAARKRQGAGRPILTERARATLVAALAVVDHVIVLDDADVRSLLREFQPEVYAKAAGGEARESADSHLAEFVGVRIAVVGEGHEQSTSELVARVRRGTND